MQRSSGFNVYQIVLGGVLLHIRVVADTAITFFQIFNSITAITTVVRHHHRLRHHRRGTAMLTETYMHPALNDEGIQLTSNIVIDSSHEYIARPIANMKTFNQQFCY
ncbi:hypothetical protein RJ639_036879 [Escallonia herrerae]|uniref:Uncharacterized protein n=1 Tax=Escallonia herrerae TaxID=1293975 RepID=A0AA88WQK8_9ASTE|nr:hypothetical protein RJ639_036879 [Escallonia herrerae]